MIDGLCFMGYEFRMVCRGGRPMLVMNVGLYLLEAHNSKKNFGTILVCGKV